MDYLAQLETIWEYFPYIFYAFVLLTFLPKSLTKIKRFADADYAANRYRYHRCYGPELCCHALIEHDDHDARKPKPRKAVTRAYLRKQQTQQRANSEDAAPAAIKRQVQASAIQTQTNVNQIAKMFESGSGATAHKKINRVLPEIRTSLARNSMDIDSDASSTTNEQTYKKSNAKLAHLLQENIENSMNLLHQQTSGSTTLSATSAAATAESNDTVTTDWHSETTLPTVVLQRRTRTVPSTLTYAGTSATPSTASPAASTPHSSPTSSSPLQPSSPILRVAPLNLKTSVEDIFAAIARSAEKNEEQFIFAGCNTLSPVTSIEDILSQRRLSRPLSAYSISDLLNEETANPAGSSTGGGSSSSSKEEAIYVESFLLSALNKT